MATHEPEQTLAGKHSYLLLALVPILAVTLALLAGEAVLRQLGERPGVLSRGKVSSSVPSDIHLLKGMIADSEGVVKYDPGLREPLGRLISDRAGAAEIGRAFGFGYERSLLDLLTSFIPSDSQIVDQNRFNKMLAELASRDGSTLTRLEHAYLSYARLPLNSEGFRSIEFEDMGSGKGKVLLLGDSFTWGYSAVPLSASFADNLAAAGYAVYNTGITSVDPAQYEHLANKYIPRLEPDVVVVSFYMANDIVWWERKLEPFQFFYYPTNAGFLWAEPKGEYLRNPQDAFEYALQFQQIPDQNELAFNRFCAQTVLGTKLWLALSTHGFVSRYAAKFVDYNHRNEGIESSAPVSELHMQRIKNLTEAFGGTFLLVIVPDLPQSVPQDYTAARVFQHMQFHVPDVTLDDYRPFPDAHFNNEGHRKYADFLIQLIERRAGSVAHDSLNKERAWDTPPSSP